MTKPDFYEVAMRPLYLFLAVTALASPAMALKVTNLDKVPHRISLEVAGSASTTELVPNQTVNFPNIPNGRLSLVTSPNPRSGSTVNADGILGKYIGNGRDQMIPVDMMDEYVIWPGGNLQLQKRMKRHGYN